MSHEIEKFDIITSVQGTEWHGLATPVPEISFENSGLTFRIDEVPLLYDDNVKIRVKDWKGLVARRYGFSSPDLLGYRSRKDTGMISYLGAVKESYQIIQNDEIWQLLHDGLEDVRKDAWKITTAGSIQGGRRVFICVELEESAWKLADNDPYRTYLSFTSSHDGTLALQAGLSNTRIVCSNTFHWHLKEKKNVTKRITHTGDTRSKLLDMKNTILLFAESTAKVKVDLLAMRNKPVTVDDSRLFAIGYLSKFSSFYNDPVKIADTEIVRLFREGKGNEGKNRYDLYNGFTDYYTNRGSDAMRRFASSELGWRRQRKEQLFGIMLDDAAFAVYRAAGLDALDESPLVVPGY